MMEQNTKKRTEGEWRNVHFFAAKSAPERKTRLPSTVTLGSHVSEERIDAVFARTGSRFVTRDR